MNFRASSRFVPLDIVTLMNRYVPRLVAAVTEGCEAVSAEAQALCPVDTGELQASIHVASVELVGTVVTGSVVADAPHAQFIEFGTGLRGSGTYPWPLPESGVPITGSWIYDYKGQGWVGKPASGFMRGALDGSHGAIVDAYSHQGLRAA